MNKPGQRCTELISKTASSLSSNVVRLMLLAVQKDNLELNINYAVKWVHSAFERGSGNTETVIKLCVLAFPPIWNYGGESEELSKKEKRGRELRARFGFKYHRTDEEEDKTAERLMKEDSEFKEIFSNLHLFLADPPFLTTSDDIDDTHHGHHLLIAITIILEHACVIFASHLDQLREDALDRAYSRYGSSDLHIAVRNQFSAPPMQYSALQFIEFVLKHRL